MMRQFELVERVKAYDPGADENAINRAYVFAVQAHGAQKRASGDPYFSHPVEVAGILATMKLDAASIVTGLLHDTVEDTVATLEQIEALFGRDIGRLVDGVTKLSRLELQSDQTKQAENFRKLVLAMSEDIRVLLVKLADRLHNMRTLHFIKSADRRKRIARETMEIYSPLAERIGMHEMKDELEDLAFAELHPDARQSIMQRLSFLRDQGGGLVERVTTELQHLLAENGIQAEISGREKSACSIWRKMQRKDVGFEQLADIMAFRAVSAGRPATRAGVIHSATRWCPAASRTTIDAHAATVATRRDRARAPRSRCRSAPATCTRCRTRVAAHWATSRARSPRPQYRWLRELLDILEHASNPWNS
jgi:GTP pyrophosphokinase